MTKALAFFPVLSLLLTTTPAAPSDCSKTSVGFTPLNHLSAATYKGLPGGLYPGGSNSRPAAHQAAGVQQAAQVRPIDGKIVLLSVGMSNTTQEFSVFKPLADSDPEKNPHLVIVDGAQGGWSAERIVNDGARYWETVDKRLQEAGVTAAQVQAAWMKEANARPAQPFPEHARLLQSQMKTIVQALRQRFPNLRLLYLSDRIYAGYASTPLNPEPFAYETGFAVKWLIEEQLQGDPDLSYRNGRAPWLSWGPYLWADGVNARPDGLSWECSDFARDGTHPGDAARRKVAEMLLKLLKTDATARPWFVR